RIVGDTQCGHVLAIAYGLVEGELRDKAGYYLAKDIKSRGWKLSSGFRFILPKSASSPKAVISTNQQFLENSTAQ
ncbi:MAG: hypothetical protein MI725_13445, partial [Pirellulales bacterium]|nr:hypothetical protein [Pirellulales bacterium]